MKQTTLLFAVALSFAACILLGSCTQKTKSGEETPAPGLTNQKTETEMEGALKIVAVVTIKDQAYQEEVVQALHAVVKGTHTEEGCIYYEAHQDINNPLVYVFIEVWKSNEAIAFHNETPHFKAFMATVDGKVEFVVNTVRKV